MNNSSSVPASSPLPWHVGLNPGPIVYGPMGEMVADLSANVLFSKERKANAIFICKACNGHAKFVAALEIVAGESGVDNLADAIDRLASLRATARAVLKTHA